MGCAHSTGYFYINNEGKESKFLSVRHVVMLAKEDENFLEIHMSNNAVVTVVFLTKDERDKAYGDIVKIMEDSPK